MKPKAKKRCYEVEPYSVLRALENAEAVIAAYCQAYYDKHAPHIGQLWDQKEKAKQDLARARGRLLDYRPKANGFRQLAKKNQC